MRSCPAWRTGWAIAKPPATSPAMTRVLIASSTGLGAIEMPGTLIDVDQRFRRCAVQYSGGVIGCETLHLGGDIHRAEFRSAHRAEVRVFEAFLGQGFVVHGARGFGIEREIELAVPVEGVARAGQRIV